MSEVRRCRKCRRPMERPVGRYLHAQWLDYRTDPETGRVTVQCPYRDCRATNEIRPPDTSERAVV